MRITDSAPAIRALVVYESMFGCTEKVAQAVAVGLVEAGATVEVHDVRASRAHGLPAFDLLVVGAPTHAFSLSRPATRRDAVRQGAPAGVQQTGLREWISALAWSEAAAGRPIAAFDTRVSRVRRFPKAAAIRAAHLLSHQGFRVVARPEGFVVEDLHGPVASGEAERARAWGRRLGLAVAPTRLSVAAPLPNRTTGR